MGAGPAPANRDTDAVLARHGIRPGPDGFDPAALAAAIEARGWSWSAEEAAGVAPGLPGLPPHKRWRALVFDPGSHDPTVGSAALGSRGARGTGPTEAAALATALAGMLGRAGPAA